jgi:hypothetical protein
VSAWCRIDAGVVEDLPYRRRRQRVAEAAEFAVDAPVSPGRVVARHFQRQIADNSLGRRASTTTGVAPAALDDGGMPAQQGARRDDEAKLATVPVGEEPGQCGEDRAVGPGWPGYFDTALQHGDLVAQDQDLGVFGHV